MKTQTKRRLAVTLVLAALFVPAELVMMDALRAETSRVAAEAWAESLTETDLAQVSASLFDYPFEFRRAAMVQLSSEQRSTAWRNVIRSYLSETRHLSHDQRSVLHRTIAFLSADKLTGRPTAAMREEMKRLAEEGGALLGPVAAARLFQLRLVSDASTVRLPVRLRAAEWVRANVILQAGFSDCSCASESSWCRVGQDPQPPCRDFQGGCTEDTNWPSCGDGWLYDCDGQCEEYPQLPGGLIP